MGKLSAKKLNNCQEFADNFYGDLLNQLENFSKFCIKENVDFTEVQAFYLGPIIKALADFVAPALDQCCEEHEKLIIENILERIEDQIYETKAKYDNFKEHGEEDA